MQNSEFTIKLAALEDELLGKLSNAQGDLTEVGHRCWFAGMLLYVRMG